MFLSLLQGSEYNKFTKNIEEIYCEVEKIEKQFYKLRDNEKVDMLSRVAYFAKTDIVDPIRKSKYDLNKSIHIQKFNGTKTLRFAYQETVGKIIELAKTLKEYFSILNILESKETHDKWKEIYFYLDNKNIILEKYSYLILHLTEAPIAYVRRAKNNFFSVYTRYDRKIVSYNLIELKDKIKVDIICEDISSVTRKKEIIFEADTHHVTVSEKCKEIAFDLYDNILREVARDKK